MKGRPLIPFAIIAVVGIVLMISLSFLGLNQRNDLLAGEEGAEEVTEIENPIEAGEELASQSCIACHGNDLTGASGPDITNLTGKYEVADIVNIILNGKDNMPPVTSVNEVEADAIAQYLLSGE